MKSITATNSPCQHAEIQPWYQRGVNGIQGFMCVKCGEEIDILAGIKDEIADEIRAIQHEKRLMEENDRTTTTCN